MRTIHKYPLEVSSIVNARMPKGARVLAVQTQHGKPCLWAEVDDEADLETRYFGIYGTGHALDASGDYIGTFQLHDGGLVRNEGRKTLRYFFHVYERLEVL